MDVVNQELLDGVLEKAKASPRLRMNHNFHDDPWTDKCQRFLNAMQPGTKVDIHHHTVDEMLILLQGKLKALIYDDNGEVIEEVVLDRESGVYGVQMPANHWHSVEVLAPDTVVFEVKEGPFVPHEQGGILHVEGK